LGCNTESLRSLRESMIGTPLISKSLPKVQAAWGVTCLAFLDAVRNHSSKASGTYYLKNYLQYFDMIFCSFEELNRTLSRDGKCALVAQESYYKDILVELPTIFTEMGESLGWRLSHRSDFVVKYNMANTNRRSMKYRKTSGIAESVLLFSKAPQGE